MINSVIQKLILVTFLSLGLNVFCQTESISFNYTGASQTWVVPNCVYNIDVTLQGASGGGSGSGQGAIVNGTLDVTPGQTLYINVGGQGSATSGGFNGGGAAAEANTFAGGSFGGGGASDINTSTDLNDRLIVAAGGGGTGGGTTDALGGGAGCGIGGDGESPFGDGGIGANLTSGGNGGPPWIASGNYGATGTLGFGGAGAADPCYNVGPGGGGGGGYYGGGGGGSDCYASGSLGGGGGGGGSSLVPAGFSCTPNSNNGNGSILIEYIPTTDVSTDVQIQCENYTWIDGNTYNTSNNTATYVTTINGCETTVSLDLSILNNTFGTDIQTQCNSYTWIDGNTYTSTNNSATYTLVNSNGCDSVVTLDLTIQNTTFGTDNQSHCNSYTWIDGNTYTSTNNSATHTLVNSNGCDSIVTLDLTIFNNTIGTDTQVQCDSYVWIDGNIYNNDNNSATCTLVNSNGCDSVVTLDLTILNTTYGIDNHIHCNSYTWIDGNTYTSTNNSATHTLVNSNGCDSIVTLDLTILNTSYGIDNQSHCDTYTWIDGNTYTSTNNSATHTLVNSNGCDSIVTLDLTILNTTYGIDNQSHCNFYTWIDGNTYNSNNNSATYTLVNSNGCDSIVTLNLTIFNNTIGTDTQVQCDSYVWIDGNTYNNDNNSATCTLVNSNGCDSIVTLDLTILNTTSGTDNQTHCQTFTWIDGNTYTNNNNSATHVLVNSNGCDSVVTLNLTILNPSYGTDNQIHCNTYTWIDEITYTSNNNSAMFTLVNSIGCDSVVTLNLTILDKPTFEIVNDQNWCETDSLKEITINNFGVPPFQFVVMKNQEVIENCSTMNSSDNFTVNDYGFYSIMNYQDNICSSDSIGKFNIIYRPSPNAEFTTIPQETDLNNPDIFFRNLSTINCSVNWDFGDGTSLDYLNFNTTHSYSDTGVYVATLVLENQYKCISTTTQSITIYPPFDIFIPNAFTPNGDNNNDVFNPTLYGVTSFNMIIINRWGEVIYQTSDKNKGWDGMLSDKSQVYINGNYTYRIDLVDYFGKSRNYIGQVTLIK
jgi:gliding motility-associated-like protein